MYPVIGRIGGDEFIAILDDVKSETDVALAAQNLIKVLREPYYVETLELRTSPSIGISQFRGQDEAFDVH